MITRYSTAAISDYNKTSFPKVNTKKNAYKRDKALSCKYSNDIDSKIITIQ